MGFQIKKWRSHFFIWYNGEWWRFAPPLDSGLKLAKAIK
jgi:hypothetical protein